MSQASASDVIPVVDVARQLGKHKATVFKVMKRLGIAGVKRRSTSLGNQVVVCITQAEAAWIGTELAAFRQAGGSSTEAASPGDGPSSAELGVFYLVQLEPVYDPGRFKIGFAASMSDRLRALRCSAPFAVVVRTWECRRVWERTVIDCVTEGCERLHTEVFRTDSLDCVINRCIRFFAVMPPLMANGGAGVGVDRPVECAEEADEPPRRHGDDA